ncbi:hypothetical protein H257_05203 [Aphanomyces astaci]|uniref:Uncharacterized protein n=1 Tax=Aphanomyces astaci TaxID=112090 RepID=W4GUQ1_APHAT|nr:hypothetical protein H257_05203 [Aphanomyces astaci]ETV82623.1 hypothetical protein H257_05203 [Aphanomyces astaci]|eukprot:XP_009828292.1 hypothetical protein H257_05203 [Aphanomyces astaci]
MFFTLATAMQLSPVLEMYLANVLYHREWLPRPRIFLDVVLSEQEHGALLGHARDDRRKRWQDQSYRHSSARQHVHANGCDTRPHVQRTNAMQDEIQGLRGACGYGGAMAPTAIAAMMERRRHRAFCTYRTDIPA